MHYNATLTFDYTGHHDHNARNRLMKALEGLGWEYVPTSSMILEGAPKIDPVVMGLEVLARALPHPGDVSMLALQVKLIGDGRSAPGAGRPENALDAVLRFPLPLEE